MLTDSGLSAAIKAAIISYFGDPSNDDELQRFSDAMGEAVVEYIKANAVVQVSGVMTGGSTVVGTIT